jgi:ribonuclease HI
LISGSDRELMMIGRRKIDGKIGAAMFNAESRHVSKQYLGTEQDSLVFAAELEAIQLAISHIKFNLRRYNECRIFSDSQAALKAIIKPQRQTGQAIIKAILDGVDQIHALYPEFNIQLEWIPGHKDIQGNEEADQAAKAAATPSTAPPITRMKSAQNRSIQSMAKTKWETEWKTGKEKAIRLRNMSQHPNTTTGPKLYGALQQRKHVVLITRLRTGHCRLNEYLYRFNKIDTPECECGAGKETVDHFLLNCELYDEERDELRRRVGVQGMRTSILLGDNKIINNTVEYIEKTGRFKPDR